MRNIIYVILLFVLFGCKSKYIKYFEETIPEEYILLDTNFISKIKKDITKSRLVAKNKEKKEFIRRKINNPKYLKELKSNKYTSIDDIFLTSNVKNTVNLFLNKKMVKSIYFIQILINGEKINVNDIVLIEGVDYIDESFYYSSYYSKDVIRKEIDNELITFIHEFMVNLPYSFENKTFFNNSIQYFTIDKITAIGKNKYEVESVIIPKALNYQLQIFEKFYGSN